MDEPTPPRPQSLKSVIESLTQEPSNNSLTAKEKHARTVARLVLVQALYQMDITAIGVEAVIYEFSQFRLDGAQGSDFEEAALAEADEAFFAEGLRTIVKEQDQIDRLISDRLAVNWRLERLDATLRAILRSGTWELRFRLDVGKEVVINEYVEIAKAFYGDSEAKFVNGALDGIATDVRPKV